MKIEISCNASRFGIEKKTAFLQKPIINREPSFPRCKSTDFKNIFIYLNIGFAFMHALYNHEKKTVITKENCFNSL